MWRGMEEKGGGKTGVGVGLGRGLGKQEENKEEEEEEEKSRKRRKRGGVIRDGTQMNNNQQQAYHRPLRGC